MCTGVMSSCFSFCGSGHVQEGTVKERVEAAFKKGHYKAVRQEDIQQMSAEDLSQILNDLKIEEMSDPFSVLSSLAKVLPHEKLREAFAKASDDPEVSLKEAMHLLQGAQYHLNKVETPRSTRMRAYLNNVLDTLRNLIENLVAALGISELFQPAESEFHAGMKFQKIMMLMSLFTLLTATTLPMFGVTTAGSIVGGFLLLFIVLSIVWPRIRPRPSEITNGENLTRKIGLGEIRVSEGRKEKVQEIAEILSSDDQVLLTGPSGAGKTQTAQAFTRALFRGEFKQFPKLHGTTVFYFNMATIIKAKGMFGGANRAIEDIQRDIGRHHGKIILVLDEFHTAFLPGINDGISEQLKSFLDGPYKVIACTTQEEYEKYCKPNKAADRRFKKIEIASTTPDETLQILRDFLLIDSFDGLITDEALEKIVDATKDKPQPFTAVEIIKECINLSQSTQKSETEKELGAKQAEYQQRLAKIASARGDTFAQASPDGLGELKEEIERLTSEVNEQRHARSELFRARKKLMQVSTRIFHTAKRASQADVKAQNELLLLRDHLSPKLDAWIRKASESLKMTSVIDVDLVGKVLEKHEKRLQEAEKKRQEELEGDLS